MLVYRVFAYDPAAGPGESGHPDYLHKPAQGKNRLDNPHYFWTRYYGATPEVAIGESFSHLAQWSESMFETTHLPAGRKVLGVFEIDDDISLLDLDDANNLAARALRPTQVVIRNRAATQAWALRIFQERRQHDGARLWNGVKWWSFHRPHWTVYGLWAGHTEAPAHQLKDTEPLHRGHPAVQAAMKTLGKNWR